MEETADLRSNWRPLLLEGGKEEEEVYTMEPPPKEAGGVSVSLPEALEGSELERRKAYAHGKKAPQVRWFLRRLEELVEGRFREQWKGSEPVSRGGGCGGGGRGLTVLDVGGGRGDLAVNICRHMRGKRGVDRWNSTSSQTLNPNP